MKIPLIACIFLLSACGGQPTQQSIPEGSAQAGQAISNKQWHCQGDDQQQWRCRDLLSAAQQATATPITAAEKATTDTEANPPTPPAEKSATSASEKTPEYTGEPLMAHPDHFFTIQLIAARKQQTIDRFVAMYPSLDLQAITTLQQGQRWQRLILGVYPSYSAAVEASLRLPESLLDKTWIRSLAPLKASLAPSSSSSSDKP